MTTSEQSLNNPFTKFLKQRNHWRYILLFLNLLLVLMVANGVIYRYENLKENGRIVYLELAPVDPRSLIQGDYMELDYAILQRLDYSDEKRGKMVISLDSNKVAVFQRVYKGEELQVGELLLAYRRTDLGPQLGNQSFFFQEGLGSCYAQARYAEIRLADDGTMLLTDLLNRDFEKLSVKCKKDND